MREKTQMDECPNKTILDFWTDPSESFSESDLLQFRLGVAKWSDEKDFPCVMAKTEDGVQVEMGHFCYIGDEFASDLFLSLRDVYRQINKRVFYNIRETTRTE